MAKRHFIYPLILVLIFVTGLSSCVYDEPGDGGDKDLSSPLRVSAGIARYAATRASTDEPQIVTEGVYYLSYPQSGSNQYAVGKVDFDIAGQTGLGIVNNAAGTELKWSDIGGTPVNFYLDNVPSSSGNDITVNFPNLDSPYNAAVYDSIAGTNDLLWGYKQSARDIKTVTFDLHHNMSRVKVQVQVVRTEGSVSEISLDDATVTLTNIYTEPKSYDRLTGTLTLNEETRSDIAIVDQPLGSESGARWLEKQVNEEESSVTYFSTDLLLPPQALAEDENRSQLVIRLADGAEYVGILPYAMFIANPSDDNSLTYPVTLAFIPEHILTIRTVITEEPPELAFMPVYVMDWVYKGDFDLEAHQSGIYKSDEFYRLIDYYSVNNEIQLERYGYLYSEDDTSEESWVFNFFSSVVLNFDQIRNSMHPGVEVPGKGVRKDFSFHFNNYPIYVSDGTSGKVVAVTQNTLYRIVTGSITSWDQISN